MTRQDRDIIWNALVLGERHFTDEQWEKIVRAFAQLDGLLQQAEADSSLEAAPATRERGN